MAESFYRELFKHRGFLRKIVSDGDSNFTNSFCTGLKKRIQVLWASKLHLIYRMIASQKELSELSKKRSDASWSKHKRARTTTHKDLSCLITVVKPQRKKHAAFLQAYGEYPISFPSLLTSNSSAISNDDESKSVEDIKKTPSLAQASRKE